MTHTPFLLDISTANTVDITTVYRTRVLYTVIYYAHSCRLSSYAARNGSSGRHYVLVVMFFLFFNQTQDLRAPSADRRETLHSDQHMRQLFNASPKLGGPPLKNLAGQKHTKFGPILHNFRL